MTVLQTFEFVTAKFEWQQKQLGFFQRLNPFGGNKAKMQWVLTEQALTAQRLVEKLNETVTLEMMAIYPQQFVMDAVSQRQNSRPNPKFQQEIVFQNAFLMGRYPVTQEQWQTVAELPEVNRTLLTKPSRFLGNKRPVEKVNWNEAVEFCARLSRLLERKYRLPSEAEWEYACRAGTTTPFYFGETITTDLANYNCSLNYDFEPKGEFRGQTTPVGLFPPNAFGIYDMHGNVWEWCADDWHDSYLGAPNDGRAWLDKDSLVLNDRHRIGKVLRGGSWCVKSDRCLSNFRSIELNTRRDCNIGFRVASTVSFNI